MKSFLRIGRGSKKVAISYALMAGLVLVLVLFAGCSGAKTKPSDERPGQSGPFLPTPSGTQEAYGPPPPPVVYGPEPVRQQAVVLVFGPGGARGFAAAGVIKALRENKISIAALLATDIAALPAALYANSESLNRLEWGMERVREEFLLRRKAIFGGEEKLNDGKKLEDMLTTLFGSAELDSAKLPLRLGMLMQGASRPVVVEKGRLVQALRATLASPERLTPAPWQGALAQASGRERRFLLEAARELRLGPVVYFDLMGGPALQVPPGLPSELPAELEGVDLVIRPDMAGIFAEDYAKKTEAAFRGRSAVLTALPELRRLTGQSVEERQ